MLHRLLAPLYEARIKDLKEAHDARVKELYKLIDILADQVDYLRWQVSEKPHVNPARPGLNPAEQVVAEPSGPKYMSEEEEDLLALHLNDLISGVEHAQLSSTMRAAPVLLEPNE